MPNKKNKKNKLSLKNNQIIILKALKCLPKKIPIFYWLLEKNRKMLDRGY